MSEAKVIRKHPPTQQDFGHLDRADWEKKQKRIGKESQHINLGGF